MLSRSTSIPFTRGTVSVSLSLEPPEGTESDELERVRDDVFATVVDSLLFSLVPALNELPERFLIDEDGEVDTKTELELSLLGYRLTLEAQAELDYGLGDNAGTIINSLVVSVLSPKMARHAITAIGNVVGDAASKDLEPNLEAMRERLGPLADMLIGRRGEDRFSRD